MCSNISSCLYCTVLTLRLTGPCHAYVQQRGRTGGWTDVWCPHETKIGAKLEALQAGNRSHLARVLWKLFLIFKVQFQQFTNFSSWSHQFVNFPNQMAHFSFLKKGTSSRQPFWFPNFYSCTSATLWFSNLSTFDFQFLNILISNF